MDKASWIAQEIQAKLDCEPSLDGARCFSYSVSYYPVTDTYDVIFYNIQTQKGPGFKRTYHIPSKQVKSGLWDAGNLVRAFARTWLRFLGRNVPLEYKGIENFLTGSRLDIRPMSIATDDYMAMIQKLTNLEKENENMATKVIETEEELKFKTAMNEIDKQQMDSIEEIRKECDLKRAEKAKELELGKLREDNNRKALEYRYFYEGLIASGFFEDDAMKILLNVTRRGN